jgi:transcriptional regulator with XRE-family HTH domain
MNLAQWMKAKKWSDEMLAAQVGVSRPFITRIRRGQRQPSAPVLAKLVEVTELPITAFLKDEAA